MDFLEVIKGEVAELNKGNEDKLKDINNLIKLYNKYSKNEIKLIFNGLSSKDRYIVKGMNRYLGTCFVGGSDMDIYVNITAPNKENALEQLEDYTINEGIDCISFKVIPPSKIKEI